MKAVFTFDEMVYNTIVAGKQIWYDEDEDGEGELLTIDYVKLVKKTRLIQVHCTDGTVFLTNQDEQQVFDVTNEKVNKMPTRRKNKKRKK